MKWFHAGASQQWFKTKWWSTFDHMWVQPSISYNIECIWVRNPNMPAYIHEHTASMHTDTQANIQDLWGVYVFDIYMYNILYTCTDQISLKKHTQTHTIFLISLWHTCPAVSTTWRWYSCPPSLRDLWNAKKKKSSNNLQHRFRGWPHDFPPPLPCPNSLVTLFFCNTHKKYTSWWVAILYLISLQTFMKKYASGFYHGR